MRFGSENLQVIDQALTRRQVDELQAVSFGSQDTEVNRCFS